MYIHGHIINKQQFKHIYYNIRFILTMITDTSTNEATYDITELYTNEKHRRRPQLQCRAQKYDA